MTLHVFTNEYEYWVGESAEAVCATWREAMGIKPGTWDDSAPDVWRQVPDESRMKILSEDGTHEIEKTCAEWAASEGPGILAADPSCA